MRAPLTLLLAAVLLVPFASARPRQFNPIHERPATVRSIDGTGNHLADTDRGAAGTPYLRSLPDDYADGVAAPSGGDRPNARTVSNLVVAQDADRPSPTGISDLFWQWGQFLDHDIDLTPVADPGEAFDIAVPAGDPWFDPASTGTQVIPLERSYREDVDGRGEQTNDITAWIDASQVYGSDPERAAALRTLDGTGRLRTSRRHLLPFNDVGLPNAPTNSPDYYLAGDFRANEQVGLTAMHVLFVREHNWWARHIRSAFRRTAARRLVHRLRRRMKNEGLPVDEVVTVEDPDAPLTGDEIYEFARAMVGAEMQAITYREFLPVLLGPDALAPDTGYRPEADGRITNEFATAAYRLGHSMLSPTIRRLNRRGETTRHGDLSLADAFFNPRLLRFEGGIEPVLRGLAGQRAQAVDVFMVDEVRNMLFGPPGSGGLDLAALNIQRGRDHGLPSYVDARAALGLPAVEDFGDITSDADLADRLEDAYGSVDAVDLWIGGLAEDKVPGALVGPVFHRILVRQFEALRDGDRFWYRRHLTPMLAEMVEDCTLAKIIRRNTRIRRELADDPFHAE